VALGAFCRAFCVIGLAFCPTHQVRLQPSDGSSVVKITRANYDALGASRKKPDSARPERAVSMPSSKLCLLFRGQDTGVSSPRTSLLPILYLNSNRNLPRSLRTAISALNARLIVVDVITFPIGPWARISPSRSTNALPKQGKISST
jgi:hypothetical protein